MGEEVKIGRNAEFFMPFNYYYITDAFCNDHDLRDNPIHALGEPAPTMVP